MYENFLKPMAAFKHEGTLESPLLVTLQIKKVCLEIMASCFNIIYKGDQDIIEKFASEISQDGGTGKAAHFHLQYFVRAANCKKLLQTDKMEHIVASLFKVQVAYFQNDLEALYPSVESEFLCSQLLKQFSY